MILLLAMPCLSSAQEQRGPPGRDWLRAAVDAFEQGDYQSALNRFARVYELHPQPTIGFNMGMCLERLGRLREAADMYRAALTHAELGGEGRARAEAQLEGVRRRLGTLVIDEPMGAEIVVDEASRCRVPCRLEVDPGTHTVVLTHGDQRRSEQISVEPGRETRVRFAPSSEAPEAAFAPPTRGYSPSWLTFLGSAIALVGGSGIVGFGLWTDDLHTEYLANPEAAVAERGETMMGITNASIGVASLGALLVLIDILSHVDDL